MSKTHAICWVSLAIVLFSGSSSVNANDAIKAKILELFPQADANGDGVISDAEEAVMSRQVLRRRPQTDKDGDGVLSDAEKQALLRMAAKRAKSQPATPTVETQRKAEDAAKISANAGALFSTEEILDESTLETKTLQDWHPVKMASTTTPRAMSCSERSRPLLWKNSTKQKNNATRGSSQ